LKPSNNDIYQGAFMAKLLDNGAVAEELAGLAGWAGDQRGINRTAELPSFPSAISVVVQVAEVAEEMDHHPDIDIRYRKLTFRLVTHAAGGVTDLDIELAKQIDAIVAEAVAPAA
jgi:4a-hydroxytetrahydrobiopterin dehydratase